MAPSAEGLVQFAELYKKEFGEELTPQEVEHKARTILCLYIATYGSLVGDIRNTLEKLMEKKYDSQND